MLRRFLFDLTRPSEWNFVLNIRRILWKIEDYDRIEYDYSCVLDHATNSAMSKTNYTLSAIYSEIDSAQSKCYYEIVKSDIQDIFNEKELTEFGKLEEIKKYIDDL